MTVYLRALAFVRRERPRLVVDVQNGLPFASTLVTRAPVVVASYAAHRCDGVCRPSQVSTSWSSAAFRSGGRKLAIS